MTTTPTAFEAKLAADYAAKTGVTLEAALEVVASMRARMAETVGTGGPADVVRTVVCPECRTRHQSELTVDSRDEASTSGTVACPECGTEAFYPVRLRKEERA